MDLELLNAHIQSIEEGLSDASSEEAAEDLQILHDAYAALRERLRDRRTSMFRDAEGRRRASVAAMRLRTCLAGCRSVTIVITQLFRISDLLVEPAGVRAIELHETINTLSRLRRALNDRRSIALENLGEIRPVARVGDPHNRFWASGIPDLRKESTEPPLTLVPFELAPLPLLAGMRVEPNKWLGDLIRGSVAPNLGVKVQRVDSKLRVYSTGVGVIRLSIALEFNNDAEIELLAAVAHKVESLLFVNPAGAEQPFEGLFAEVVDAVAKTLFNDPGDHDRRWRPPDTIFRFHQQAFVPEDHIPELAYLMSLSPGNSEKVPRLRERAAAKFRSKHWTLDGVFALASYRVVLMLRRAGGSENERKIRNRVIDDLIETHELVTTGIHTRRLFAEDFRDIREMGGPDYDWLPGTPRFDELSQLAFAGWRAVKAVASIPKHLQKTGEGLLTRFASELWAISGSTRSGKEAAVDPIDDLKAEIVHIAKWIEGTGFAAEQNMAALAARLKQLESVAIPFAGGIVAKTEGAMEEQSSLENDILDGLEKIEALLDQDLVSFVELDQQILRVELARRNLLGS